MYNITVMEKTHDKSIIKNGALLNALTNFFYSKYYPVYVALFSVLFYTAKTPVISLVFYILLACLALLFFRDLTPFMPLPVMLMMSFSDLSFFGNPFCLCLIGLCAICLIAHFILYPIKKFKFGKLFLPICLVSVALFAGGLFSPYLSGYARGLASSLTVGPMILLEYLLFTNYFCPPDNFDYKEHFIFIIAVAGCLISADMLVHEYLVSFNKKIMYQMGFGNTNIMGAALLVTIPACWYFVCVKRKMLVPFIALIFNYLAVYLTNSDGALGVAGACIPVLATIGYIKADEYHKKTFIKWGLILCGVAVLGLLIISFKVDLYEFVLAFLNKVSTDNGRTPLYILAIEMFSKYPIFGIGLGYFDPSLNNTGNLNNVVALIFSFHSTFFHIIATMGILGIITYAIYYVARYKIILKKDGIFNVTTYLSFSMLQVYGMIDTCEFHALPILIFLTLFFVITERSNNEKGNDQALPLTRKDIKFSKLI